MTMKDLPGWRGTRKAHIFCSITEAMRLVRAGKVATVAGHAGAINVYRARDGDYRGQLMKWCSVVSSISTPTLKDLREWLVRHMPETGDADRLAFQPHR